MNRRHLPLSTSTFGAPTRLVVAGAVGALLLLGALNPSAAGASGTAHEQGRPHSSYIVQHEASVAPNATHRTRSHRLAIPAALLVTPCAATLAARRIGSCDRRTARRRVEQFHMRLRGPPPLLLAHTH